MKYLPKHSSSLVIVLLLMHRPDGILESKVREILIFSPFDTSGQSYSFS